MLGNRIGLPNEVLDKIYNIAVGWVYNIVVVEKPLNGSSQVTLQPKILFSSLPFRLITDGITEEKIIF